MNAEQTDRRRSKGPRTKAMPGICQLCGCTDEHACRDCDGSFCHWINPQHTLCSTCAPRVKNQCLWCGYRSKTLLCPDCMVLHTLLQFPGWSETGPQLLLKSAQSASRGL